MAVVEKERGGGNALTPHPPTLSPTHTLVPSPHACLTSHWLNPQLYIYVIGQGGVYIHSMGRLNLATSFQTLKQGRQAETVSSGQTAAPHTPRKKKTTSEEEKRPTHCGFIFRGNILHHNLLVFSFFLVFPLLSHLDALLWDLSSKSIIFLSGSFSSSETF